MKNLMEETNNYIANSPIKELLNKEEVAYEVLKKWTTIENILEYKKQFNKTKGQMIFLLEYAKEINFYTGSMFFNEGEHNEK
jgi:hypothetical protein